MSSALSKSCIAILAVEKNRVKKKNSKNDYANYIQNALYIDTMNAKDLSPPIPQGVPVNTSVNGMVRLNDSLNPVTLIG